MKKSGKTLFVSILGLLAVGLFVGCATTASRAPQSMDQKKLDERMQRLDHKYSNL